MIDWQETIDAVPDCDREIIVKNTSKVIKAGSGLKRHYIMKFRVGFTAENIQGIMLDDGYTQWGYL